MIQYPLNFSLKIERITPPCLLLLPVSRFFQPNPASGKYCHLNGKKFITASCQPRYISPRFPPESINSAPPPRLSPPLPRPGPSLSVTLPPQPPHRSPPSRTFAAMAGAGQRALALLAVLAVAAFSVASAADAPAPSPVSAAGPASAAPLAAALVASAAAFLFAAVCH
jgi:hypothetical protein